MAGPLAGLRVFDLTHAGVGPWATMLMAAMGADVVKIESPTGDTIRQMKPRYRGLSAVYLHCNLGKRGVVIDLKSSEGQEAMRALLAGADVFAENMRWGAVQRLGLAYEHVAALNPTIVYGNYPGWGGTGPYGDRGSADLTAQAFSGAAAITGMRDGSPELIRWYALHDFNASSYIVVATLLGLLYRSRTGRGTRIESPQVAASIAIQLSRLAELLAGGETVRPLGSACSASAPHRAFKCLDGRWLAVAAETPRQWRALCAAIGEPDLATDPRFATNRARLGSRDALEQHLGAVFAGKPARWWTIRLQKRRVPVSLFHDYETVPDLPQVRENACIVTLDVPGIGPLPFGSLPIQFSRTPAELRPGPQPGQDTEQVLRDGWRAPASDPLAGSAPPTPPVNGPLDGVTVVDLSQGLCGPYASLILADAGAHVLKVEPPEGDYARELGAATIDGEGAIYAHLNRNKDVLRLDLDAEADRARLLDILADADVVIEDTQRPVLARLGLPHADLLARRPGLIVCRLSPQGDAGPLANQPVAELQLQAQSDFLNNLGRPGEEPVRMGPDMGSLGAGLFAAQGILAALYAAWRDGHGQVVTVNLLGTLIHQRGVTWTSIADPDEWAGFYCEGATKPPDHGYLTVDGRIVLGALRSPRQLEPLLHALGVEHFLGHGIFQEAPRDIMGWHGTGDLPIRAKPLWEEAFRGWKREALLELLDGFGSYSAPINTYEEMLSHPQTIALDLIREMPDADGNRAAGPPRARRVPRQPYMFSAVPGPAPRPLRVLSEDSADVHVLPPGLVSVGSAGGDA